MKGKQMQATFTLCKQDVEEYLATKADEEVIGFTCHARECLLARVAAWKFGESVEVCLWTVHFSNGSVCPLDAELEHLYHRFDALNLSTIERPVTKREWLEACAACL